ncbi:PLP-dependent aminotransferase family protein [Streptomyces sp. NBC_01795]|uniref:aminotransferase-like domain-containing protein n=1 Tax=unclassified Streptomyces TaxID=2593676 RepID=UPI002DD8C3C2|nr:MULTISPECIES: PLP-dependent aminotransferase family protein [unclassified Streptomyces]WSA94859.1 PLP-dependent aminotransferase family protein [Streptomyces sp. NBC_01795]WSB79279.1 PLP-dependent aminotransferase family protein [Streptomyces sp. NBC_01775]WSS12517.1 PLP-dependent aminotransferase family protein [Streptomyces sp. NBC_01186]
MRIGDEQLVQALGPWRNTDASLSAALARAVREALLDGRVRAGSELPAERRLAAALGVSRGTVTAALDRLRDAGWVRTRHGSASRVQLPSAAAERIAPLSATGEAGPLVDLRRAVPAAPQELYLEATRRAVERAGPLLAEHGEPGPGIAELRSAIAARYSREGTATRPEQILVTSGARSALTLLAAHFRPRVAVVEIPTFFDALQALRAPGTRLVGCQVTTEGWDLDQLRDAFAAARGHLAYLVPDFHNPTGALMPPHTRRTVTQLAAEHQVTLVVDETMRDLDLRDQPEPAPRLRGALLIGSTSKSIWGGLRIGWIRASASLIRELRDHPLAGPLSAAPMQQLVAAELLADLEPVLGRRRHELRQQRDHLGNLLADDGRWDFTLPSGGLALWLRLTTALADTVVERAGRNGVALAAGPRFAADATLIHHLRVPYTPPRHVLDQIAAVLDGAP